MKKIFLLCTLIFASCTGIGLSVLSYCITGDTIEGNLPAISLLIFFIMFIVSLVFAIIEVTKNNEN